MDLPDLLTREVFDAVVPLLDALAPAHAVDQIRAAVDADRARFYLDPPWLVLTTHGVEVFRMPVSQTAVDHWRALFPS